MRPATRRGIGEPGAPERRFCLQMEAPMTLYRPDPIHNAGSNPNADIRRTGGTEDDPHGGQPRMPRRPDPDPIEELATIDGNSLDNRPDTPHLARQPGPKPGFGPDPNAERLVGNPELGIDPREAPKSWENGPKAP